MSTAYKKMTSHGSISIPVAMRRELGIKPRDAVEVCAEKDGTIVIRPYQPRCIFCGTTENVTLMKGRGICRECMEEIKEAYHE